MSAESGKKRIRIGQRYHMELRKPLCILAVPMAFLSALSISVFRYMRSFADVGQYFDGERSNLLAHSLSLRTLLFAAALWLFYVFAFHAIHWRHAGSAVIALVLSFNMLVSLSMEHSGLWETFLPGGAAGNIAVLLGFAGILYALIEFLYMWWDYQTRYRVWADERNGADDSMVFFGAFACILILWLPVLYCCYPGSVHNDTRYQIMSWLGLEPLTAAHPILTTVFYGTVYQLGMTIGGQEKAILLGLLCQDLIVSAAMGLVALYVYRYTRSKTWFWLTIAFFGILPVWQSAAQVLLKDVLHTGCFLLFACVYLNCLRGREKSWKNVILLFLTAVLVAYTRKAAFYLAVLCILAAAVWHWRSFLLPYLAMLGVFVGLFWFSSNVLYPYLDIVPEWESDNYSMQLQQVALYCRTYQEEMTDEEIAVVNTTLNYNTILREYTPLISDPVKITYKDDGTDHAQFWQLYRQMFRRHPMLFVKAVIMDSFEHYNPWNEDINYYVYISREGDFITVDYKSNLHQTLFSLWNNCLSIPVIRLLIGTGLYAWMLLIAAGYGIRRKSRLAVLGLLPSILLAAGLIMSHINGNIRYGYPLIAAAPLNVAWVLYTVSRRSPENPSRGTAPIEEHEEFHFKLFRRLTEEELREIEFDPDAPPPELPPEERTVYRGKSDGWNPGPALGFVMRYVPVPSSPKTYLDVLKVLAIFLVLWNHTATGYELYNRVQDMPQHMLYLCFSIFDKIAVPLFFMASGALLLGREESWRKILAHRVRRFALILLVVSAINYLQYFNDNSRYSFYDFICRLYTGSIRTPLWYLYAYLAFLLSLPFLRKLARCMREQDYMWLVVFFVVTQLLNVVDFFWFHGQNYHISDFRFFTAQNYVVYALTGFYIERVMKKERVNLETLTVLIILSVLSLGATYLLTEWRMKYFDAWTPNNSEAFFNTFMPIMSVTVFYIAKLRFASFPVSRRTAAVWSLLASGTFGTYLFERFWRDNTEFVFQAVRGKLGSFAGSLVHILAACILGILATLLYKIVIGMLKGQLKKLKKAPVRRKKAAVVYTVPAGDLSDLEEIESLLVGNSRHKADAEERKENMK